jgi:glycosyltransferase involved in cell wall biosynthesis
MSVGRPTISTNVGDLEKLIKENKLGIVTPCNPDLFAEETINLLLDPQKLEYFGNSARHAAETVFNWETTTSDLYSFYKIFL